MASLLFNKQRTFVFNNSNVDTLNKNQMLKAEKVREKTVLKFAGFAKLSQQA